VIESFFCYFLVLSFAKTINLPFSIEINHFFLIILMHTREEFYVIGSLLLLVWLTSIFHWWKPRFSTFVRRLDFAAVQLAVGYGSYFATEMPVDYTACWFAGIGVVAVIFVWNETMYYLRMGKRPSGDDADSVWATRPGTPQRETALWTTAIVHDICVHIIANSLCIVLLIAASGNDDVRENDVAT
jgi:hypothetical protein